MKEAIISIPTKDIENPTAHSQADDLHEQYVDGDISLTDVSEQWRDMWEEALESSGFTDEAGRSLLESRVSFLKDVLADGDVIGSISEVDVVDEISDLNQLMEDQFKKIDDQNNKLSKGEDLLDVLDDSVESNFDVDAGVEDKYFDGDEGLVGAGEIQESSGVWIGKDGDVGNEGGSDRGIPMIPDKYLEKPRLDYIQSKKLNKAYRSIVESMQNPKDNQFVEIWKDRKSGDAMITLWNDEGEKLGMMPFKLFARASNVQRIPMRCADGKVDKEGWKMGPSMERVLLEDSGDESIEKYIAGVKSLTFTHSELRFGVREKAIGKLDDSFAEVWKRPGKGLGFEVDLKNQEIRITRKPRNGNIKIISTIEMGDFIELLREQGQDQLEAFSDKVAFTQGRNGRTEAGFKPTYYSWIKAFKNLSIDGQKFPRESKLHVSVLS